MYLLIGIFGLASSSFAVIMGSTFITNYFNFEPPHTFWAVVSGIITILASIGISILSAYILTIETAKVK